MYDFVRYLAAKKSVDDKALNRRVWEALARALPRATADKPLRVLEVGAGIGTMVERATEWGLLDFASYTAIDAQTENITAAKSRLQAWAERRGMQVIPITAGLDLKAEQQALRVELEAVDVFDFIRREQGRRQWDLLIAHAFLDLVDIPDALPRLFSLIPAGWFYFTINFDGVTSFQPEIDSAFDAQIERLYHRTMDERLLSGKPSGDSRSGRRMFGHLRAAGAEILAAGSSDWVLFPRGGRYPAEQAYFLHFIIHTMHGALAGHPELDADRFDAWIAARHAQIERGELVYIAHQLDFAGRAGGLEHRFRC